MHSKHSVNKPFKRTSPKADFNAKINVFSNVHMYNFEPSCDENSYQLKCFSISEKVFSKYFRKVLCDLFLYYIDVIHEKCAHSRSTWGLETGSLQIDIFVHQRSEYRFNLDFIYLLQSHRPLADYVFGSSVINVQFLLII